MMQAPQSDGDDLDPGERLVPVSEAIRYRDRAKKAERRIESLKRENNELSQKLSQKWMREFKHVERWETACFFTLFLMIVLIVYLITRAVI